MVLSRTQLDSLAQIAMDTLGSLTELVTYHHKPTPSSALVSYPNVRCYFGRYSQVQIAQDPVLQALHRVRIPFAGLAIEPTRNDVVQRATGERWQVMGIEDGRNRPSWFLQCKQVV